MTHCIMNQIWELTLDLFNKSHLQFDIWCMHTEEMNFRANYAGNVFLVKHTPNTRKRWGMSMHFSNMTNAKHN